MIFRCLHTYIYVYLGTHIYIYIYIHPLLELRAVP
jgi:hypothetical protein